MEIRVSLVTVEMRRVGHSIEKMKRKNQIFALSLACQNLSLACQNLSLACQKMEIKTSISFFSKMDMYSVCMNYIVARQLQVEVIEYGEQVDLNEYLLSNLEASAKLIQSMLLEYQTNPARRPQLELELDSAVLGWMETWNAIHS
jgi:hypothetical protein